MVPWLSSAIIYHHTGEGAAENGSYRHDRTFDDLSFGRRRKGLYILC
jgi:hypothetical protein